MEAKDMTREQEIRKMVRKSFRSKNYVLIVFLLYRIMSPTLPAFLIWKGGWYFLAGIIMIWLFSIHACTGYYSSLKELREKKMQIQFILNNFSNPKVKETIRKLEGK